MDKFNFNPRYTTAAAIAGVAIEAVFTDEAGEYIVEKHNIGKTPFDFRLAIKRVDRQPIRSWRLLQDIKNDVAGADREAIEIYPPESEATDTANMYHLWVFMEGYGSGVRLTPPVTPK